MSRSSARERLSPAVRRFLGRHIDRVEELKVLVFLAREPSRFWSAAAVARSVHLPKQSTVLCLEDLARRGLLDLRLGTDVVYRFDPATPELHRGITPVFEAYRGHRTEVLAFPTSLRRSSLKDSSDAFRLGKESDDG